VWQKTGSFSLYFSKLKKKKKFNEPELQKKKKLKTNLVKDATKKKCKNRIPNEKKRKLKKRRKCRYKTIHYPPTK